MSSSYTTYTITGSSRKYQKPIIHSRASSSDSRSSYESRGTDEPRYYTSSKTSTGYYGGSQSKVMEEPQERRYRVPDNEKKYITSKTRGDVEVIDHRKRILDPAAPRSGDATSSHYKETQRHSSHKHPSHRR